MTQSATEIINTENYSGRIILVRRSDVEPDPKQPRSAADADLRASIEANGIQQPIVLRPHPDKRGKFMLVDGERRWRGSEGVLEELPARIDDRELSRADLLIVQATYNQGKPLPAFDEAVLFQALSKHGLSDQEIARRLGKPRSTVGDRRRMLELPAPWVELIRDGKLGVSHAPIIQRYLPIPAKYHEAIAKRTVADLNRGRVRGEEPTLAEFENSIWHVAASEYVREIGSWQFGGRKYEGPVLELPPWPGGKTPRKYAADPAIWKPLIAAAEKDRAKENRSTFDSAKYREQQTAEQKRRNAALKKKTALRHAQYSAISARLPQALDEKWSLFAVRYLLDEMHNDALRMACKLLDLEVKKVKGPYGSSTYDYRAPIVQHAEGLDVEGRSRFLLQLLLVPDAYVGPYEGTRGPERLSAAAKLLRIDLAKIKVEADAKPNGKKPNKWERRNKRGKAKHTAGDDVSLVPRAAADVDDVEDGEGSGWDGTTREDLWDDPEKAARDDDDEEDREDLDEEDLECEDGRVGAREEARA